ncbi:MAG: ribosome-binding factor A [Victivallaceae bacterium]|jgi:ribosome-binding factor A|nr:ribosome-binding factor A [Victivallaceae bacterium]NLK83630.1 ribosome-binding factor A [Lentisphaerota bacterium]MDD3117416.1 ribosome-binding factor A [Victivallaceae bacterium]MDD3704373.1 ribosome-binding factor A [Victivallaceae bacterium]MDD4318167.1 ribosome-binding factor A [Victivallaceae bacterium]
MGAPNRMVRVNEVIKRELAELLERETWDGLLVSVLDVSTAPDLRNAIVLISIFGINADARRKVLNHLHKIRPALQKKIATKVILKYTPVLEFRVDDRIEAADRVISLLEGKNNDDDGQE